jgi:hypothetical protein
MTREKGWELRKKGLLNVDVKRRLTKGVVTDVRKTYRKKSVSFYLQYLRFWKCKNSKTGMVKTNVLYKIKRSIRHIN